MKTVTDSENGGGNPGPPVDLVFIQNRGGGGFVMNTWPWKYDFKLESSISVFVNVS